MDGGRVSLTVTLKLHSMGFPPALALHVTIVSPTGNRDPEGGVQVAGPGGLHVADAMGGGNSTTVPPGPWHSTVMSPGQMSEGVVSSTTMTSKLHVAMFPEESLAVQVTVVVPKGKTLPLGGVRSPWGAHRRGP
jgi:hypothetical protein